MLTVAWMIAQIGLAILVAIPAAVVKSLWGLTPWWLAQGSPVVLIITNCGATILALAYALPQTRSHPRDLLILRPPSPKIVAVSLLALVGMTMVVSDLANGVRWVLPVPAFFLKAFSGLGDFAHNPWSASVALVVMAPVTEEIFFRGVLLRRLLTGIPPWSAIWVSALAFALMHFNPWQLPVALALGLLIGWFYARTRSLALCVGAHAFVNALSFLKFGLPFTVPGYNASIPSGQLPFQPWWFDLAGLVALLAGVWLFAQLTPPLPPPPRPIIPPSLPPPLPGEAAQAIPLS